MHFLLVSIKLSMKWSNLYPNWFDTGEKGLGKSQSGCVNGCVSVMSRRRVCTLLESVLTVYPIVRMNRMNACIIGCLCGVTLGTHSKYSPEIPFKGLNNFFALQC